MEKNLFVENESALLYGQLQTSLDFADLLSALNVAGLTCRIGESCHYTSGYYLRITSGRAELTFEKIEASEYLIKGDASSAEEMSRLAKSISATLQQLTQKHRFEIYFSSEPSQIIGYFHFDWPQENEGP